MAYCSACEEELTDPHEQLHDPDNLAKIVEGGVSNPDSYHIKAVDGPNGPRLQCSRSGQMASIEEGPPPSGSGTGGDRQPNPEPEPEPQSGKQPKGGGESRDVYDIEEDKSAMSVLDEVVSNPAYGLDDEQIAEINDWGEIYDGQIPPSTLESILANMSGIAKQKAELMRQKYEAKLNKWVRNQAQDDQGPSIGATISAQPNSPTPRHQSASSPSSSSPNGPQQESQQRGREDIGGPRKSSREDFRQERKKRRLERRNEVMDRAAEEMAKSMASEAGKGFFEMRDLMMRVLKSKAEKDPDWFLEKADELGINLIEELAEPSEARKEEMEEGVQSRADMEVDEALGNIEGEPDGPPEEPTRPPDEQLEDRTPKNNNPPQQERDTTPMSESPEDEEVTEGDEDDEDEVFDELMSDVSE